MEKNNQVLNNIIVDDKIFIIRGIQVMVDRDFSQRVQAQEQSFIKWRQND
jgi:hypothetical protein